VLRLALVALTLLAFGCRSAKPRSHDIHEVPERYEALYRWHLNGVDMEPLWAALPFDSVELRFVASWQRGYHLRLQRHGEASLGNRMGEIGYSQYARLCFLIERLRVAEMHPLYEGGGAIDGDYDFILRVVASDGTELRVEDQERRGPPEFQALVTYIESIKDDIRWSPTPIPYDDIQARLVTESWHVHSYVYPVMPLQGYPIEFSEDGSVSTECIGGIDDYLLTDDLELRLGGAEAGTRLFFTYDQEAGVFVSRSLKRPPIVIGPAGFKFTEYTNGF